jgi:dTDP-4-amino-4,6-dideoxygalactose transaminase
MELALRGVGVKPDDEVVLAAYDFTSNFHNVLTVGARPVLVDVRSENCTLDPQKLPAAIGPNTRAIIASHLHGGIVNMAEVTRIAREHGVAVIEDAAHMSGARVHGRMAGAWGDAGILSFGGSKLVTAGRGGAVLTGRDDVAQRILLYAQRGMRAANDVYPLSELQAAAVIPQWIGLAAARERRTAAVEWLVARLNEIEGLVPFRNEPSDSQPDYYKLGLLYDPGAFDGLTRDGFVAAVRAEGIALDAGFRGLHKTHSSRRFRAAGDLAEATRAHERVLGLHHPVLQYDEGALAQVIDAVTRVRQFAREIRMKIEDRK